MEYEIIQIGNNPNNNLMIDSSFKLLKIKNAFDAEFVKNIALKYEPDILKLPDGNIKGSKHLQDTVTVKYQLYNAFNFPEMLFFKDIIKKVGKLYLEIHGQEPCSFGVSSWFNIFRNEASLENHNHIFHKDGEIDYLFAISCCISCNSTYTVFYDPYTKESKYIENKDGEIYVFPSWVTHSTEKTNGTRITLSADCSTKPDKFLSNRQWSRIQ
tara:strand:+ start:456 stop:1094 length:639 start_codon:yes stop_codon:yes gene_type:complete